MKFVLNRRSILQASNDSMHLVLPPEPSQAASVSDISQGSSRIFGSALLDTSNSHVPVAAASTSLPSSATMSANVSSSSPPPYPSCNQYIQAPLPHLQPPTQQPTNPNQTITNPLEAGDPDLIQHVHIIRTQIENIERGLDQGITPSMEHVIRLRTRLLEIQDTRDARQLPLAGVAELISRVLDVQQRTRILEAPQQQHVRADVPAQSQGNTSTNTITNTYAADTGGIRVFIIDSPMGERSLLVNTLDPVNRIQPVLSPNESLTREGAAPLPNPNAAVVQNAVRQAMVNQERRGNNIEHAVLTRQIRRIWLFARLWFFCYLSSAPGTWRRYIFVSIALLVTFLSETDIPQQILRLVIAPVQRHLEGLTHAGGPADPATQAGTNDAAAGNDIWGMIRRLERSIVLLFASLVPGLGERQVQARTAADQAYWAERERERQARLERDQASERQEQEQAPVPQAQEQVQEQRVQE